MDRSLISSLFGQGTSAVITYKHFVLALLVAVGALLIGEYVYLGEYLTTDENSYLFQAWLFLQGELRLDVPPLKEALFHRMIIIDDQAGWLSRYPPGHAAWLMPGVAAGYPRIMVAVAAFLSVLFLVKAGERLKVSFWLIGSLLLFSPYFWLMQGSVLSHTSGLAATAIMVWAYLVWLQDRSASYAAIAGLAWAFLFLNRTYTAVWIALPFAVDALLRLFHSRTRNQLIGTLVFAGCAATGVVLYLIYNAATTGNPFIPTFLIYNSTDGPGFGVRNGKLHSPAIGLEFLKYNLNALNNRLWGFTGSLIAWFVLVIAGWKKGITPLMLAATLLIWLGYTGFWFRGINQVAPTYYYETLVFMILTAGMGLSRLLCLLRRTSGWVVVFVVMLLVSVVGTYSFTNFKANADVISKRHSFKAEFQRVIHDVPSGSIVLLNHVPKDIRDEASWNPHGLKSDPLIMRDGYGILHPIHYLFPNRPVYMVKGPFPKPAQLLSNIDGEIPVIHANNMHTNTGFPTNNAKEFRRIAEASKHKKGYLGYRRYQYLISGKYEVKFFLDAAGTENVVIGRVDLAKDLGEEVLVRQEILPGDSVVTLNISLDEPTLVEPRVFFKGNGRLVFDRIEIRLVEANVRRHY